MFLIENFKVINGQYLDSKKIEILLNRSKNDFKFSSFIHELLFDTIYILQLSPHFCTINDVLVIDEIGTTHLHHLAGLKTLDLSDKNITSLEGIERLSSEAGSLKLNNNKIIRLKGLMHFSSLEVLDISNNSIKIIENNSLPSSLKVLTIDHTNLPSLMDADLPSLEAVWFYSENLLLAFSEKELEKIQQFINKRNKPLTIHNTHNIKSEQIIISPLEQDSDEIIYLQSKDSKADEIIKFPLYLKNFSHTISDLLYDCNNPKDTFNDPIQIAECSGKDLELLIELLNKVHRKVKRDRACKGINFPNKLVRKDGKYIVMVIHDLAKPLLEKLSLIDLANFIKSVNFLDIVDGKKSPFLLEASMQCFVELLLEEQSIQSSEQLKKIDKKVLVEHIQQCFKNNNSVIKPLEQLALKYIALKKHNFDANEYDLGDVIEHNSITTANDNLKLNICISSLNGIEFFPKYTTLKELSLSGNCIQTIPSGYFESFSVLEIVDLSNNGISTIEKNAFSNVALKKVDLSNNKIKVFNPCNFKNAINLEKLDLTNNPLRAIDLQGQTLTPQDLPKLTTIKINHTPINIFLMGQLAALLNRQLTLRSRTTNLTITPLTNKELAVVDFKDTIVLKNQTVNVKFPRYLAEMIQLVYDYLEDHPELKEIDLDEHIISEQILNILKSCLTLIYWQEKSEAAGSAAYSKKRILSKKGFIQLNIRSLIQPVLNTYIFYSNDNDHNIKMFAEFINTISYLGIKDKNNTLIKACIHIFSEKIHFLLAMASKLPKTNNTSDYEIIKEDIAKDYQLDPALIDQCIDNLRVLFDLNARSLFFNYSFKGDYSIADWLTLNPNKTNPSDKFLSLKNQEISKLEGMDLLPSSLEILDLSNNFIKKIKNNNLSDLQCLKQINLSDNKLEGIGPGLASTTLQKINLSNNQIKVLKPKTFNGLPQLVSLILCNTNIEDIESDCFNNLLLQSLDFRGNKIKVLKPGMFNDLPSLTALNIADNPIESIERFTPQDLPKLSTVSVDVTEKSVHLLEKLATQINKDLYMEDQDGYYQETITPTLSKIVGESLDKFGEKCTIQ